MNPYALSTPGAEGMISGLAPISLASALACTRSRSAERDEPEVARVVAALHAHHPQGGVHVLVGDVDDRLRRGDGVDPQALADLLDRAVGGVDVELERPTEA